MIIDLQRPFKVSNKGPEDIPCPFIRDLVFWAILDGINRRSRVWRPLKYAVNYCSACCGDNKKREGPGPLLTVMLFSGLKAA